MFLLAESPIFFPRKAVEEVLGTEFKAVSPSSRTPKSWVATGEKAEVELQMINKCTLGVTVTRRGNIQEGQRSSLTVYQIESPAAFDDGMVIFDDNTQSVHLSKEKIVFHPDW